MAGTLLDISVGVAAGVVLAFGFVQIVRELLPFEFGFAAGLLVVLPLGFV